MASENRGWDTSTALIRRTFRACIENGRRAQGREGAELWEAYRLMGTGLHTLEDLLAHSNWCELALRKMGHNDVFCHVGDDGRLDYYPATRHSTQLIRYSSYQHSEWPNSPPRYRHFWWRRSVFRRYSHQLQLISFL